MYERTGLNMVRYYLASKNVDCPLSDEANTVSTDCNKLSLGNTSDFLNDDSLPDISLDNEVFINFKSTDPMPSTATKTSSEIESTTLYAYSSGEKSNPTERNMVTLSKTFERNHTSLEPTTDPPNSELLCQAAENATLFTNFAHEEILPEKATQESMWTNSNYYSISAPLSANMAQEGLSLNCTELFLSSYEIIIHRGPLAFQEMLSYFKDASISHKMLSVMRVLPSGVREQGEDTGGVLRDLLAEFWADFYSRCTVGRTTKVPCLRHDFGLEEWKSIARVLCYGWDNAGYWPVQLSCEFMNHCLYGEMPTPNNQLADYFEFVAFQDKQVFQAAIDNYETVDKEDLLEALDPHDCHTAVRADNIKAVLIEMTHKEILQMPMYASDCWREVFSYLKVTIKLTEIYSSLSVTNKKVVSMLQFPLTPSTSESEVTKNLKKYVWELDSNKLGRFLRYCTGSDLITVPQIKVEYFPMNGASRRPIAHTCGCVLMLPNKYDKFMEFRSDFDSVLESNVWVMDIV